MPAWQLFPAFSSNQFIASRGRNRVLLWAVERLIYSHKNKKLSYSVLISPLPSWNIIYFEQSRPPAFASWKFMEVGILSTPPPLTGGCVASPFPPLGIVYDPSTHGKCSCDISSPSSEHLNLFTSSRSMCTGYSRHTCGAPCTILPE